MSNRIDSLDQIKIAKPCPMSWDGMVGDDQKRLCSHCACSVFNLSELTREEAKNLMSGSDAKICVRMHMRADGKVMTKDCARPLPVASQRRFWFTAWMTALLAVLGFGQSNESLMGSLKRSTLSKQHVGRWLTGRPGSKPVDTIQRYDAGKAIGEEIAQSMLPLNPPLLGEVILLGKPAPVVKKS